MRHPHYDLHNSVTPCTPFHLCRPSCKKSYNIDLSRPPKPKLTFKFASSSSSRARLCSVRQLAIDDPVASSRPPALFGISATCCFSGPLGLLGRKMHTGCGWHIRANSISIGGFPQFERYFRTNTVLSDEDEAL